MAQIEVEKKFLLSTDEEARLLAGASLFSEKTLTDTYYDAKDWSITTQGWWLRSRNGSFELKIPAGGSYDKLNQYHEITDDAEIAQRLGLSLEDSSLAVALEMAQITPFVTCTSQRRTYKKSGFTIDLDMASYEGSDRTYTIGEIELLVEKESDMPVAAERIFAFAHEHAIEPTDGVRGKIAEFMYHEQPEHYDTLVASGTYPPSMARQ